MSDYAAEGVPLIFVRNIRSAQFNSFNGKFVSKAKAEELRAHQVCGGDILITKMGDPPGDACVYPKALQNAIITADCIKWLPCPMLPATALFSYFITSNVVHSQILERTRGVAQLKISLARFKDVAIPLPPLSEQTYLLDVIEEHIPNGDKAQKEIEKQILRAASLRQSILQKAFSGLLVPQDPNDEPASVLLERIRAERVAAQADKGKRGKKKTADDPQPRLLEVDA